MFENSETTERVFARRCVQRLHPLENILICSVVDHSVGSAPGPAWGRFDARTESILISPGVALAFTTWGSRSEDEIYNRRMRLIPGSECYRRSLCVHRNIEVMEVILDSSKIGISTAAYQSSTIISIVNGMGVKPGVSITLPLGPTRWMVFHLMAVPTEGSGFYKSFIQKINTISTVPFKSL